MLCPGLKAKCPFFCRLRNVEAVDDRQAKTSAKGHRKAVPARAALESTSNHERGGGEFHVEPDLPVLDGDSAPKDLAMLLQRFVDRLGFAGCIRIAADPSAPHSLATPKPDGCFVEGLIPGLGRLRLEQIQENTENGQKHS